MVYNSQHSFAKFKKINEFKELSLDSTYKRLNDFQKRFNKLKNVTPQPDEKKNLQDKVLTMSETFLMNCITFTRINTMKKKLV